VAKNPFENFYPVPSVDELIDIAYHRGSKKGASIPSRFSSVLRAKRNEVSRIKSVNEYVIERIKNIIQSVPNLDALHPFYQELSHLLVDKDRFKQSLGRLNGIIPVLQKLLSSKIREINKMESSNMCSVARRQYYARAASILKEQKDTLAYLEDARRKLKTIPVLDTELPAVVIAGYPNVGKSSLVRAISTAKPKIREYPFTTKEIIIGLYKKSNSMKVFQLIDTPGILDRPMIERNEIEKQAILALRTISNIIIYVFDPTATSGYSVDNQITLFNEILQEFIKKVKVPYLMVFNKMDLATKEEIEYLKSKLPVEDKVRNYILTNAKDGENMDELVDLVMDLIKTHDLFHLDLSKFTK
jgi:nucleolar GTP-binding protein